MRVFYDTEFHERGSRVAIEFISIGMVRDDGAEYYAISNAVRWHAVFANEWLRANVLPHLPGRIVDYHNGGGTFEPDESSGLYLPPAQIAKEVADFCVPKDGDDTCLYAYYADYDHVVVAQLFGTMLDLPTHMPMYTRDFKQINDMLRPGYKLSNPIGEHNALNDARWLRDEFVALERSLVGSKVGKLVDL